MGSPKDCKALETLLLSLELVINGSHFEREKAQTGGGIIVFATAGGRCTSASSIVHKSVYIMNSKLPQNLTDIGRGVPVGFKQNSNVLIQQCNPFKEYSNNFQ